MVKWGRKKDCTLISRPILLHIHTTDFSEKKMNKLLIVTKIGFLLMMTSRHDDEDERERVDYMYSKSQADSL